MKLARGLRWGGLEREVMQGLLDVREVFSWNVLGRNLFQGTPCFSLMYNIITVKNGKICLYVIDFSRSF